MIKFMNHDLRAWLIQFKQLQQTHLPKANTNNSRLRPIPVAIRVASNRTNCSAHAEWAGQRDNPMKR